MMTAAQRDRPGRCAGCAARVEWSEGTVILFRFIDLSDDGAEAIFARYGVDDDGVEPQPGDAPRGVARVEHPALRRVVDVHDVLAAVGVAPWSPSVWRMIDGRLVSEPAPSEIGPDGLCTCGCGWAGSYPT